MKHPTLNSNSILRILFVCFLILRPEFCHSLTSSATIHQLSSPFNGDNSFKRLSLRDRPATLAVQLTDKKLISCRKESRLYLDIFGLGAPEVLVTVGAVFLLYGPGKVKEQLKSNGVKGKLVGEAWREEHTVRVAEVKKYAVLSRQKRAWVKINLAIESEDSRILAKLAELDAKNPDTIKALAASMEEDAYNDNDDDDDDDYDDDDDDDDDDEDDEEELVIPLSIKKTEVVV